MLKVGLISLHNVSDGLTICSESPQVVPPPRQAHTAVWDGADSLIIFGGNNGDNKIFGDVRLLSLSTGYW